MKKEQPIKLMMINKKENTESSQKTSKRNLSTVCQKKQQVIAVMPLPNSFQTDDDKKKRKYGVIAKNQQKEC